MELTEDEFLTLIKLGPLVSIDLVIRNDSDQILLGLRNNEPAKNTWFVPGGRVRKEESIESAFARISSDELKLGLDIKNANFLGVYRHDHDANFAEAPGIRTVYLVLAYEVKLPANYNISSLPAGNPPKYQHREFRWFDYESARTNGDVHAYSKDYFHKRQF